MAIEGPLKELNIQDVLQLLALANKTGVLTVRSDRLNDEALVHFSNGDIVFAVRRRSTRRIGQLLIRAGRLTQRELHAALEVQRSDPNRRLAEILLDMGTITEDELERQLRFQMEETIYELMSWTEGYFKFEERTEIALQRLLATIRVDSLLMEGARRTDEWTRLESAVPGPESVPVLAPAEERDAVPLELRTEEWEVLAEIDGERDIRQLAPQLAYYGVGGMQVLGYRSDQTAIQLHVGLAIEKSREGFIDKALQRGYLLFDGAQPAFQITLNFTPQTVFQMSVDHSRVLRVVVLI